MAEALLYAAALGAAMGVVYDFFRLPRLVLRDKFFFDFLFWMLAAVAVYCYLLIFCNGIIKGINIFTVFAAFAVTVLLLGCVTEPIQIKAAKKIKIRLKSFKKVLQNVYKVYYNRQVRLKHGIKAKFKGGKNGKANGKQKEDG